MSGVPAFKLVEAGFSQTQVEALSESMETEAARRADLESTEHRLEMRISESKADLKSDIAEVKADLKSDVAELKATQRLHNWMLGFNLALTLLILGKLFIH